MDLENIGKPVDVPCLITATSVNQLCDTLFGWLLGRSVGNMVKQLVR